VGVIIGFLGRVPAWVWLVAALAAWGWIGRAQLHAERASRAADERERAIASQKAERERSAELERRITEQTKARNEANAYRKTAAAAADRAATADARVRELVAQLAAAGGANADSAAGCDCQAASTLGDLFHDCRARYRALAADADEGRAAGLACERSYDALSPSPP
jgi:hypothetical protein